MTPQHSGHFSATDNNIGPTGVRYMEVHRNNFIIHILFGFCFGGGSSAFFRSKPWKNNLLCSLVGPVTSKTFRG